MDLPPGVIPVTSSASQVALTRSREDIGTCPFDDPDSDLYAPVASPEDTDEWWDE